MTVIDKIIIQNNNTKIGIKESEDSSIRKLIYTVPLTENEKLL